MTVRGHRVTPPVKRRRALKAPKGTTRYRLVCVSVSMTPEMYEAVKRVAQAEGFVSVAEFVRYALRLTVDYYRKLEAREREKGERTLGLNA